MLRWTETHETVTSLLKQSENKGLEGFWDGARMPTKSIVLYKVESLHFYMQLRSHTSEFQPSPG